MSLGINGVLNLNSLAGTANRILYADANGNLTALAAGTPRQFLQSNATWGNLPAGSNAWTVSGSNIFNTNIGNVGINTPTPQFNLDVNGNMRVKNNLFVQVVHIPAQH